MIAEHTGNEILFEEVQSFRQPWVWGLIGGCFLVGAAAFGWALITQPAKTAGAVVPLVVFCSLWGVTALFLFSLRLTVRVDRHDLHVTFFPLVRKRFPLDAVATWESRTYRPILEYGGWGIRYAWGKGWAYNVSGKRGVQLEMADGKRVLIGSQRPDELAAALTHATGRDGRAASPHSP